MRSTRIVTVVRETLRAARWTAGALLVAAACATPALAVTPAPVPEVDPGSAASALTMLLGGALLLTDRRRRRR